MERDSQLVTGRLSRNQTPGSETAYRPAGSCTENRPELVTGTVTRGCWAIVNRTVPGIGRGPGCWSPTRSGPPSIMSLPATVPGGMGPLAAVHATGSSTAASHTKACPHLMAFSSPVGCQLGRTGRERDSADHQQGRAAERLAASRRHPLMAAMRGAGDVSADQLYLASLPGPATDGSTCVSSCGLLSPGVCHAIRRAAA
jgi:hypothetical protein